jgi:uncharacterized cupredoxin-like copper-binding protein
MAVGRIAGGVAVSVVAVVLAACGGGGGGGPYGSTGGGASSRAPAATGTRVTAEESEFTIKLSSTSLHPGGYTFTVHNAGTVPHNLTIEGPGVSERASPTLPPGASGQVSVTLKAGTYQLFCSVDAHRDKGMQVSVRVR